VPVIHATELRKRLTEEVDRLQREMTALGNRLSESKRNLEALSNQTWSIEVPGATVARRPRAGRTKAAGAGGGKRAVSQATREKMAEAARKRWAKAAREGKAKRPAAAKRAAAPATAQASA